MLTGNRLAKVIFLGIGILVLFVAFYYELLYGEVAYEYQVYVDTSNHQFFHGFGWFMNKVSEFPGISPFYNFIRDLDGYLGLADTNPEYFDWSNLLACIKMITIPFVLIYQALKTVVVNIWWFFSFFFDIVVA